MIEMVWLPDSGVEQTVYVRDVTDVLERAVAAAVASSNEQEILTLPQVSTTLAGPWREERFRASRVVSYRRLP